MWTRPFRLDFETEPPQNFCFGVAHTTGALLAPFAGCGVAARLYSASRI
jgi:hypothetical protein